MSDTTSDDFSENGLTIESLPDLVSDLDAALETIYGSDINLDSDSPDGQLVGIICQLGEDLRELLLEINAGFDPDQAFGTVLDQRVAMNNIERNGGTFTITPVNLTVSGPVSLVGLDDNAEEIPVPAGVYTIQDSAGNQYALLASVEIEAAGTASYSFRAVNIGNIQVAPNSITIPISIVGAVTEINNPSSPTQQGQDEETDSALRVRRRKSTAIVPVGYLDSIEAALATVNQVTFAKVYENTGSAPDGNGIPAHGIWCVIEGGSDADIGAMLYAKKIPGGPMKGSTSVTVTRADGIRTANILFDRPTPTPLYVQFNLSFTGGAVVVDIDNLKSLIVANVAFSVGQNATSDAFIFYIKGINQNYLITNLELSLDGTTWAETVNSPTLASLFTLSATDITINGST